MTIVTTHVTADFDAFASVVGAGRLYPGATLVLPGSQNRNVRQFIGLHADLIHLGDAGRLSDATPERLVMVDTRVPERLGELRSLVDRAAEIVVFDHHPETREDVASHHSYVEAVGATTTIIVEEIRRRGIALEPLESTLLALGIHEDTGSLTYPSATARDAEALAWLMEAGANTAVVSEFLNLMLTPDQHDLLEEMIRSVSPEEIGGKRCIFLVLHRPDFTDGASVVAHKVFEVENADVLFVLLAAHDRTYIIARSRTSEVSCTEILADLGGGGHPQAASGTAHEWDPIALRDEIRRRVTLRLSRPVVAGDIMTKVVQAVRPRTSVREAHALLTRYGHSGLPVTTRGRIVGIISRRDIDKAVFHDLAHAPVKGFMSKDVVTVTADTPLHEIEQRLIDKGIGRLPVVEEDRLVGIVTRTDVLRALHGETYTGERRGRRPSRTEMSAIIEHLLPERVVELLKLAGFIAEEKGFSAYLVGGIVRDLLLGLPNLDVDIVIEGDGVTVGELFAKSTGSHVNAHRRFGTAAVIFEDGFRVDFASARREFYARPGALPEVELSNLMLDLLRRDFSINAMAIALARSEYGALIDIVGGFDDLQNAVIRVLYNLSFVDDPTRIVRAVRFEGKFGFKMGPQTEGLAREATRLGVVGRATGVRLRDELIDLLSEDHAAPMIMRLADIGALAAVHDSLRLTPVALHHLDAFESKGRTMTDGTQEPLWMWRLTAMTWGLTDIEFVELCDSLRLKRRMKEFGLACRRLVRTRHRLKNAKPSATRSLLSKYPDDTVRYLRLVAAAERGVRERVTRYLDVYRNVEPLLTGRDIIDLGVDPSPLVGKVKRALVDARLDGEVRTRRQEERLVKQMIAAHAGGSADA